MDNSEKQQFDENLKQLHEELDQAQVQDEESRRLLQHVQNDIQAVLKEPSPASHATLRASLKTAIAHFEDSHPRLTLAFMNVLDHLAEV